ncbi:MAG TPA: alpha/beta fold hydrolase [Symbiobacteriaceae bacterium]|nr:alpha/beta fold hydrolase [Symbiobacteriaceae bacterium]
MLQSLKRALVAVITALLILPLAGTGLAAGEPNKATEPGLVPLRPVAEAAGAKVEWNAAEQAVTVTRDDVVLVLRIGEGTARWNGQSVPVGAPVSLDNGRTMIPLPFLKAALGVEVAWDATADKAVVDSAATRAMDFFKALVKGTPDPETFTPAFRAAMPAPRLAAIAAQLQQVGSVVQMTGVAHTKSAVHENVQFVAAIGQMALDVTVRFDLSGSLVDDYYMNVYAGPTAVAGTPRYANPDLFTETEVLIGPDGAFPLPGTLAMPAGDGPFPALVLVHGSGPNDRDETVGGVKVFRDLAQGLATRGIAVLRYEKRTREHSQKVVMLPNFGLQAETTEDALLAASLLRAREGIDPRRVFVLGHSQGGFALPRMLEQDSQKVIAGGIIAAGPNSFLDTLYAQSKLMVEAQLLPEAQLPFIAQQIALLRDPSFNAAQPPKEFVLGFPQYYLDLRDPVASVAMKVGVPLLIFQGARDFQVPVSQFESWQKELAGRDGVTFRLYPKLNHIFTEGEGPLGFLDEYQTKANVPAYVIEDIAAWIRNH